MIEKIKKYYEIYSFLVLFSVFAVFFLCFIFAALNGITTGRYWTKITINNYGEAYPELVMLVSSIPGVIIVLKDMAFKQFDELDKIEIGGAINAKDNTKND
jgi:hypothetical protein